MAVPLRTYPPLGLNGHIIFFFVIKQPETEYDKFVFCPAIFVLKQPYFFFKYCNNPDIKYLPTNFNVICPYLDKFFFIFKWQQNFEQSSKKSFFSSMAGPLPLSPLMARSLMEDYFVCDFSLKKEVNNQVFFHFFTSAVS